VCGDREGERTPYDPEVERIKTGLGRIRKHAEDFLRPAEKKASEMAHFLQDPGRRK